MRGNYLRAGIQEAGIAGSLVEDAHPGAMHGLMNPLRRMNRKLESAWVPESIAQ